MKTIPEKIFVAALTQAINHAWGAALERFSDRAIVTLTIRQEEIDSARSGGSGHIVIRASDR